MSFSFRNLFAQDRPEGGEPPGGAPANPFSASVEKPANPFSAATGESESRGFESHSQSKDRGSFEALFAARGMNAAPMPPQASGRMGRYSIREMIPFLPPSLVSLEDLPLDKSVEVPLAAGGGTEVKLSVIQSVCPEIFATEITPLNDSEVTLPPSGQAPDPMSAKGGVFAGISMGAKRESRGLFGKREAAPERAGGTQGNPFSEGTNPFSAGGNEPEPVGGDSPLANPFSAAVVREESTGFVNPFTSPPVAEKTPPVEAPQPAPGEKESVVAEEKPAPAAQRGSAFGFPSPQAKPASLFGAFGSAPQQVAVADEPLPAPGGFGKFGGESPFGGGFSGDLPAFAKPVERPAEKAATPTNVSLSPDAEPEKAPEPAPAEPKTAAPVTETDPLENPYGSTPTPSPKSPWSGELWADALSDGDSPFGGFEAPKSKAEPEDGTEDPVGSKDGEREPAPAPDREEPEAASPKEEAPAAMAPRTGWPLRRESVETEKPTVSEKEVVGPVAAPVSAAEELGDRVVFSLRDVLLPMSARTGIDFSQIPPQAKVRLPMSLIESQLPTGEVALRVSDLSRHTDAESALLLKRIDPLLVVPLPQNELFHQLQDLAPELLPASGEMDLEAEFSTLFASEAASDAGLSWLSPATVAAAPDPQPEAKEEVQQDEPVEEELASLAPGEGEAPTPEAPKKAEAEAPLPQPAPKRVISVTRSSVPARKPAEPAAEGGKVGATPGIPNTTPVISASATPKTVAPKIAAPESEDPFASFNIPGPLSMDQEKPEPSSNEPKSNQTAVETFSDYSSASESREGGRDLGDPYAPLPPRKATAQPAGVGKEAVEEESGGFFDDLDQFSDADLPEEEPGESAAVSAGVQEPAPMGGFASLDDLEPFRADTTRAWPSAAPTSAPAPKPKPEPEPVAEKEVDSPVPVVAPVFTPPPVEKAESDDDGGFFEELDADRARVVETSKAEVSSPAPSRESAAAPRQSGSSLRDIELRAVFGTNEAFTYKRVADLTANLPGVMACAIVGPGIVVQAPRGRESGDLASRAGALVRSARDLAEATGMANSETFTFHTDSGVISLFTHGECCLTVSHAEGQFDPGVREKLILVARGLAGLEN